MSKNSTRSGDDGESLGEADEKRRGSGQTVTLGEKFDTRDEPEQVDQNRKELNSNDSNDSGVKNKLNNRDGKPQKKNNRTGAMKNGFQSKANSKKDLLAQTNGDKKQSNAKRNKNNGSTNNTRESMNDDQMKINGKPDEVVNTEGMYSINPDEEYELKGYQFKDEEDRFQLINEDEEWVDTYGDVSHYSVCES